MEAYLALLRRWSDKVDLVATGSPDEWMSAHILDAVGALTAVSAGARSVVDVGSGAGLPGLVWAICRPDLEVTLCEPRKRRAAFLRAAVRECGLAAEVVALWAEALPLRSFDVAVGRAVAPYSRWLALGAPLVGVGGAVVAMLGPKEPDGWGVVEHGLGLEIGPIRRYRLPGSGASRRAVSLTVLS